MSASEKIRFQNAKFGEVSIDPSQLLTFSDGLPGFERCREYGLVSIAEEEPFLRLLSIDEPAVGFVLINPMLVWPDYNPGIGKEDLEGLEIASADELSIYSIVTLSQVPEEITANLKGPIFVNTRTMKARQMILVDERYSTKHSILAASREKVS